LILAFILAGGFLAYVVWRGSAPIRAGGWRVGAGLGAVLAIVIGIVLAIRGEGWLGLPLAVLGLGLALGGRWNRRTRASATPSDPGESMSVAEARSILGVDDRASAEDIKAAHLRHIKRNHPDQGGTTGLASKLNAARDRLLRSL
jgi:hypothetical protein